MSDITKWQVLIVEDEQDSMDVVQEILGYYDIKTYPAASADEAMRLLKTFKPTLAVLDLALPGTDGWSLLQMLREHHGTAAIPIVAVTAFHSTRVAQEAIAAGFDAYFTKPVEATSFVRELERVLAEK